VNADALFALLAKAREACGHAEYVVIGSVSILGVSEVAAIPADMTVSIDADCYTRADPDRIFELQPLLGEGSPYHVAHGVYLDPVSPRLPTLPPGGESRLERDGIVAWCLEPNDAAVSKLARADPNDLRWVRAGAAAGIVSLPMIRLRMRDTSFFDRAEQDAALKALDSLQKARRKS
jgi:hypothetical protein